MRRHDDDARQRWEMFAMFTRTVDGDGAACDGAAALETASNAEVDRVIQEVIREHGANAAIEAATRMMPTLDEGAVGVRSLWQRVLESAQDVQRESRGQTTAPAEAHS
jgi:hypothetical protein